MTDNWTSQQIERSDIRGLLMLASSPKCRHIIQSIIDHLPCGVTLFDQNLEMIACNGLFRRLLVFPDKLFESSLTSPNTTALRAYGIADDLRAMEMEGGHDCCKHRLA
ncbi:hypothetical protein [Paramagnetospirillum kuznetsovii]|jgi:hypothetical protein|uniref:hypothetical protein n=1 Tax=Paramagnetospirillum kuznetsovii TaxID=2053833 RepID=UPI001864CADC|nr:hypothetical protein [Paramagnetospirillum kuznetsovii]